MAISPAGSPSSTSCLAAYPATIPPPQNYEFRFFHVASNHYDVPILALGAGCDGLVLTAVRHDAHCLGPVPRLNPGLDLEAGTKTSIENPPHSCPRSNYEATFSRVDSTGFEPRSSQDVHRARPARERREKPSSSSMSSRYMASVQI